MNGRILLSGIKSHLASASALNGVKVGTGYDAAYLSEFAKTYPAVWVVAQRMTPLDDGAAYSGQFRQHCRVDISVTCVVQRVVPGSTSNESALDTLFTNVAAALKDWRPTQCDTPFVWQGAQDGQAAEAVLYASMQFSAQVTYARSSP